MIAVCVSSSTGRAQIPDSAEAEVRISTVAENGMPENIVKPGSLWNFVAGEGDILNLVNEDGLMRTSASHFGAMARIADGMEK
jgi:hypothetical protein